VTSEQTKTFRFKCHLGFPFCVGKNAYGLVISLPLTTLRSSPNFREHDSTLNDTRAVVQFNSSGGRQLIGTSPLTRRAAG
jgi:hypothetical protein